MRWTVLVVLIMLVPVQAASIAGAQEAGSGGQIQNASEREILTLETPRSSGFVNQPIDVSTTISLQRTAAVSRFNAHLLDVTFEQSTDEQTRRELLFTAATDVEIKISTLQTQERTLRQSYINGSISHSTFVRRYIRINQEAVHLRDQLELIQTHTDSIPQFSLRSRIGSLQNRLVGFNGPVSNRITRATTGAQPAIRVFVSGSENGLVLTMIDDGQFVREAYRTDHRTVEQTEALRLDQAVRRTSELYPVASSPQTGIRAGVDGLGNGLFRITIQFRDGELTSYIDSGSQNVFYEIQQRDLDLLQYDTGTEVIENETRLVINQTYAGGPLRIATFNNQTGTPTQSTIIVNDQVVSTGEDGVVWTLGPVDRTEVVAIGPRGSASVMFTPINPSSVRNT